MKRIFPVLLLTAALISLCWNLNPFSDGMFPFHDETQAARVQQFSLNVRHLKIPPRMAPDFSFRMGYPIFDLYAPFSYWVTTLIHLVGFTIIQSLQIAFALAVIVAAISTYLFLRHQFQEEASAFGALLYVTCLYVAVDIFVRGNLAETWFIALLPAAFAAIHELHRRHSRGSFVIAVIILGALFTTHNILSILSMPLIVIYIAFQKHRPLLFTAFFAALLASMYFFIPLIAETSLTHAKEVATLTHYADHFLCPQQLWQSPWGFAGSAPGCETDGFSFKVGKIQLLSLGAGIIGWIYMVRKSKKKNIMPGAFFLCLTAGALFLTTYASSPIWNLLSAGMSVIQFPWRFISFSIIGISYFGAFAIDTIQIPFKKAFLVIAAIGLLIMSGPYFSHTKISNTQYTNIYISSSYIENQVAYKVSEYLPTSARYDVWKQYDPSGMHKPLPFDPKNPIDPPSPLIAITENTPYRKAFKTNGAITVAVNIHYFPYWRIRVNSRLIESPVFDTLGRPLLSLKKNDSVVVSFSQSRAEQIGDLITIITLVAIAAVASYPTVWKKTYSSKA